MCLLKKLVALANLRKIISYSIIRHKEESKQEFRERFCYVNDLRVDLVKMIRC